MKRYRKNDKAEVNLLNNSKVSLDLPVHDRQGYGNTLSLTSFVERVNHDNSFLIRMPEYQNSHYPLRQGEMCLMYFTAEPEKIENPKVYTVPVCFSEKIEHGNLVYARMEIQGNIERSQRRDCYRLPISIFVSLKWLIGEDTKSASAKMLNFSDGGMLLETYEKVEVGQTLILDFNIGDHETLEGEVLRAELAGYGKRGFRVAVKFNSVDKKQKQRFYRFIMEKQAENQRSKRWAS